MNKEEFHHAHPIQIFFYIRKLLIWLIIPLIRGLFSALTGDILSWIKGAWLDIWVLILILGVGVLQWHSAVFSYNEQGVTIKKGLIIRQTTFLPVKNIMSILMTNSFYLRPLKALSLRLDTSGGSYNLSDFNFIVSQKTALNIADTLITDPNGKKIIQKSNLFYITALSLITSNSFAGIMLITAFISNLGEIIGEELSKRIYGTFRRISNALAFGIPPAAAALAYILLIGWFVTFIANVIRYKNLTVTRLGLHLNIKGGLFTVREYTMKPKSISFIDIRQTLLTKLLRLYSVFVYAIGYGKTKEDVSAVIPAVKEKNLYHSVKKIMPKYSVSERTLKPNLGAFFRFTMFPLWLSVILILLTVILVFVYPDWKNFLMFIGTIMLIPSIWFFTVRTVDLFTSGISKSKNCYTVRYSKGFYFHTIVIPKEKIVSVKTSQSMIQKFDKKCDVIISTYSEGFSVHKCRNLDKASVLKLFSEN